MLGKWRRLLAFLCTGQCDTEIMKRCNFLSCQESVNVTIGRAIEKFQLYDKLKQCNREFKFNFQTVSIIISYYHLAN